jgi:hypothetical protein
VTSEVEKRIAKIGQELDRVRLRLGQKTAGRYPSEATYKYQRRRAQELLVELEGELSALECPGEYSELAVATVADELGITCSQVRYLIKSGEIEATGKAGHERVSRAELERSVVLGAAELLRLSRQESAEIFEEAVPHLQHGDLELSEMAYRRLRARGAWQQPYVPIFLMCLEIAKGDFDSARDSLQLIQEGEDPFERRAAMSCLRWLLEGMHLRSDAAQAFREQLLTETGGAATPARRLTNSSSRQPTEQENELQHRAAYLAAAMQLELRKYEPRRRRTRSMIHVEMPAEKFDLLLRNAIYTTLYAEANCLESETSRTYIARINSMIRKSRRPAVLLENLSRDDKNIRKFICEAGGDSYRDGKIYMKAARPAAIIALVNGRVRGVLSETAPDSWKFSIY